jgi:hypothetical protein
MTEYRVIFKREGRSQKSKKFTRLQFAQRYLNMLTSKTPWEVFGQDGEAYECCSGHECGCGGMRVKDSWVNARKDWPKLLRAEIQERQVGEWVAKGATCTVRD